MVRRRSPRSVLFRERPHRRGRRSGGGSVPEFVINEQSQRSGLPLRLMRRCPEAYGPSLYAADCLGIRRRVGRQT